MIKIYDSSNVLLYRFIKFMRFFINYVTFLLFFVDNDRLRVVNLNL